MQRLRGDFAGYPEGGFSGQRYLDQWKEKNGTD